jgi:hypothetical protein
VAGARGRVGGVLTAAGAPGPAPDLEELPGYHGRLDSGLLILPAHANVDRFPLFAASHAIALPAPCPAWSAETAPPQVAFEAQELIASWVTARLSTGPPPTYSPQAGDWLRRTPAAAQQAWVASAFENLRTCRLAAIRMPWHE